MTATAPAAGSRSARAGRRHHDHAAHPLSGDPRQRLQPAGGLQPLRQPVHHHRARRSRSTSASNICCCSEASPTTPCSPTSTASIDLGAGRADLDHHLYQPRHPGQPRRQRADRQRLASTSASDPAASCCRRTWSTPPTSRRSPRSCASPPTSTGRSSGSSAASIRTSTASTASACPPRATTPSPTPTLRRRHRRRRPPGATASRSIRPTMPTCPTTSARSRSSARRSYDFTPALHGHRRRPLLRLQGRRATSSRAACSPTATTASRRDRIERLQPARDPDLRGGRQRPGQRPGLEGLPARRRQRSAQHPALQRRRRRRRRADLRQSSDLRGRDAVELRGRRARHGAAASTSPPPPSTPTSTICRSPPTPAPARRASSSTCPSAHTMGVEVELRRRAGPGPRPVDHRQPARSGVRFRRARPPPAWSSPACATATGCRPCRTSRCRRARATPSRSPTAPKAYVGASYQHVGSRYTQPSDQENNPRTFVSRPAVRRRHRRRRGDGVDLRLPAYDYVNLSAGIDWDNGLGVMVYVTNLFDENALLSFDRERGGRARLGFNVGQPRIIGITLRKRFGA